MMYANKLIHLKNRRTIKLGDLLNAARLMSAIVSAWDDRLISMRDDIQVKWLKLSWERLEWTAKHTEVAEELLARAMRMKEIRCAMQAERRQLVNYIHRNEP